MLFRALLQEQIYNVRNFEENNFFRGGLDLDIPFYFPKLILSR